MLGGLASMIACNAGGMVSPDDAGGSTSLRPETHSRTTVSPDSTVSTGGNAASNMPRRMVAGVGGR
jgi:hypothetical protein